jgi:hypothetical protein
VAGKDWIDLTYTPAADDDYFSEWRRGGGRAFRNLAMNRAHRYS